MYKLSILTLYVAVVPYDVIVDFIRNSIPVYPFKTTRKTFFRNVCSMEPLSHVRLVVLCEGEYTQGQKI